MKDDTFNIIIVSDSSIVIMSHTAVIQVLKNAALVVNTGFQDRNEVIIIFRNKL